MKLTALFPAGQPLPLREGASLVLRRCHCAVPPRDTAARAAMATVNAEAAARVELPPPASGGPPSLPLLTPLQTVWVSRGSGGSAPTTAGPGQQVPLAVGDAVYLAQGEDGGPVFGFRLERVEQAGAAPPRGSGRAGGAPTTARGAKRKSPEPDDAGGGGGDQAAAAAPGAGEGLLAGAVLAFWKDEHSAVMQQKAREAGGVVEGGITAATTHVVVDPSMTVAAAAARFARCLLARACRIAEVEGCKIALPQGVAFVTTDWVAAVILLNGKPPKKRARLVAASGARHGVPEERHCPAFAKAAEAALQREEQKQQQRLAQVAASQQLVASQQVAAPQLLGSPGRPPSPIVSDAETEGEPCLQQLGGDGGGVCTAVARRGAQFVPCDGGHLPRYTGATTGLCWGHAGVWQEPFSPARAAETVGRLRQEWMTLGRPAPRAGASAEADEVEEPASNGVCEHAACSRRPYCLVERLEEFSRVAYGGKGDQFKRKAIQLLQRVWGVSADIAQVFYVLGVHSIADLRAAAAAGRVRLTMQQECGVKFYDDFQHRIPRAEVAAAEARVRDVAFALVEEAGAGHEVERTVCRGGGSYARGSAECRDIDLLVCLPPALSARQDCGDFLGALLDRLLAQGLLLPDCNPEDARSRGGVGESASWMGVARVPGHGRHRRIDIKVYPHHQAPFATMHFCSGEHFNRAIRYWATRACALAQRQHPQATGYKLSDKGLFPMHHTSRRRDHAPVGGGRAAPEEELGPSLPAACERDVFEALGLEFVPIEARGSFGGEAPGWMRRK